MSCFVTSANIVFYVQSVEFFFKSKKKYYFVAQINMPPLKCVGYNLLIARRQQFQNKITNWFLMSQNNNENHYCNNDTLILCKLISNETNEHCNLQI